MKTGSKFTALGILITAWDLAHFWFLKAPNSLIPPEEWKKKNIPEAIFESGLAERMDGGVYVKGTKAHCKYLEFRSDAGKRGAAKTNEILHGKRRQNTPSYSSSFSLSSSDSKNKNNIAQQVDRVYQELYPRKIGKTKGVKKLAREIKTPEDLASLEAAVKNYASHCAGRDKEFIKHFSTFAGEWRDWIKVEASSQTAGGFDKERYEQMLKEMGIG